jgi:hypothetical protein
MNEIWDTDRLKTLISSRIEESFSLEYKAARALDPSDKKKRDVKTEITKDVSAMANSSGGTIIYGMAEYGDVARCHLAEKIDPIDRTQFPKEWLEHVISNIEPRIATLKIIPITIPPHPNQVVYVVEVPKGTTAHQALDLKYYRRYNFEAVAMRNDEIRDVMSRQQFPTLEVEASFGFDRFGIKGYLHFEVRNIGDVLANYFSAVIHVPAPVKWQGHSVLFTEGILDELKDGTALRLNFDNSRGSPLFPKSACYRNFECGVGTMEPEPEKTIQEIRYRVYADAMPFIEGRFDFEKISRKAKGA